MQPAQRLSRHWLHTYDIYSLSTVTVNKDTIFLYFSSKFRWFGLQNVFLIQHS